MIIEHEKPKNLLTQIKDIPWHERLGHPNRNILKILSLPTTTKKCVVCDLNKSQRLPFTHHFEPVINVLDCLHMDLVGPITPPSISQCQFFLTITNQASLYKMVRFLKNKSECFEKFERIKKKIEVKQERKIKRIVSDQGGEFLNQQQSVESYTRLLQLKHHNTKNMQKEQTKHY
ncbi:hypothetical protein O181_027201 [Austropuccinia psidii MF-1]|uniref:Integrase catalytic domain-containing protein n=1 Tax=Austropuccinia psidii MF-1 TaxID=1389203 RepID=A0A9Q3CLW8_9BASI|nr:hypothetical protein [Austropuccinia psidii MF-1]